MPDERAPWEQAEAPDLAELRERRPELERLYRALGEATATATHA